MKPLEPDNPPARYFPPRNGRYRVAVGLSALGRDFGNGPADARALQLDRAFGHYRREKLRARGERLGKYWCRDRPSPRALGAAHRWCLERLSREYPRYFRLREDRQGLHLHCELTGERLHFDDRGGWQGAEAGVEPAYGAGLDALACQVQEDLALMELDEAGRDRISALHLCFPNHWAAEDKIGGDFSAIHRPVAGFGPIARQHGSLVDTLVQRGPFVRFAWGLATDRRLNHHPVAPPGSEPRQWAGRRFDADQSRLYLRVERQVLWGLPQARACLFTIRTYLTDCADLAPDRRTALGAAVAGMDRATLDYKGLNADRDALIAWLMAPERTG